MAAVTYYDPTHTPLAGEQATRERVREALIHAHVVHFSCHGAMNWNEPLQSGLLMAHDGLLTVQDVFDSQLSTARLAALSACETGIVSSQLPDEVVMLPSALMQAGFLGVISTLWSVDAVSTAILMERFYYYWQRELLPPADALLCAQQWVRDTTNNEKQFYYHDCMTHGTLPETVIRPMYQYFLLQPPDKNNFAHPFYWAGFSYTGV
jgi:CHAT domain-containing protein